MPDFNPFGLRPSRVQGSGPNSTGFSTYRAVNNVPTALFRGDPVALVGGTVTLAAGSVPILGVFWGASWWDPVTGQRRDARYLPAGTSSAARIDGDTRPLVQVIDGANKTFTIQCDSTVSVGDIGWNFNTSVSSVAGGGGSTIFGLSIAYLLKSSRTSAGNSQFRIVDIFKSPDNALDSAATLVEVIPVAHQATVVSVTP